MEQDKIEVGSCVKVIHGDWMARFIKVFDVSYEGNFIAVGVKQTTQSVAIDDVIVVSKDDFNNANYDELSQDVSFFWPFLKYSGSNTSL